MFVYVAEISPTQVVGIYQFAFSGFILKLISTLLLINNPLLKIYILPERGKDNISK